jgi:hypothetical protein
MKPAVGPSVAERVRTLAAVAVPTHVSVAGTGIPASVVRGGVDPQGRPVFLVKPSEVLYGTAEDSPVTVDLVATRGLGGVEHPRGLLKVHGWAQAVPVQDVRETAVSIAEECPDEDLFAVLEGGGPKLLRVEVMRVVYLTCVESGVLDAADYLGSEPDPLLESAERAVRHINEHHRDQLARSVESIDSITGAPVPGSYSDVWLWELDRYGATVRVGPDRLVRLPWGETMPTAQDLQCALNHLLCPH